jgi:hypothetical protein
MMGIAGGVCWAIPGRLLDTATQAAAEADWQRNWRRVQGIILLIQGCRQGKLCMNSPAVTIGGQPFDHLVYHWVSWGASKPATRRRFQTSQFGSCLVV